MPTSFASSMLYVVTGEAQCGYMSLPSSGFHLNIAHHQKDKDSLYSPSLGVIHLILLLEGLERNASCKY